MLRNSIIVGLSLVFATACGGGIDSTKKTASPGKYPAWYLDKPTGCGVGSAKHRGILDLARKSAVASARHDLAGELKVLAQGLIDTYKQAGAVDDEGFSEELQTVTTREVVDQTLSGTKVATTDVRDTEFFAMVCVDPDRFADSFDRAEGLNKKQRQGLRVRAKDALKDMNSEIEAARSEKKRADF